jgi:hypothetical protein
MGENIQEDALTLFPYAEHPASRLEIAHAAAIDADIECNGSLDRFDNVSKGDRLGRTGELITAAWTAAGTDETSLHQVADYFFKIIFRDLLLPSDNAAASDSARIIREMNHCAQRILDLARDLHQAHFFTDPFVASGSSGRL